MAWMRMRSNTTLCILIITLSFPLTSLVMAVLIAIMLWEQPPFLLQPAFMSCLNVLFAQIQCTPLFTRSALVLIFILFVFLLGNLICNYVLGLWGVGRKTLFFCSNIYWDFFGEFDWFGVELSLFWALFWLFLGVWGSFGFGFGDLGFHCIWESTIYQVACLVEHNWLHLIYKSWVNACNGSDWVSEFDWPLYLISLIFKKI